MRGSEVKRVPHRQALAEIALVFAVFFVQGAWPAPDVNEPYYLGKAIHFWNPTGPGQISSWTRPTPTGSSTSPSAGCRWGSRRPALAWVGRLLTWGLLAWSWRRLSWPSCPPRLAVLTAAVRLPGGALSHGGRMGHRRRRGQGLRLRPRLPRPGGHGAQPVEPRLVASGRRLGLARRGRRLGRRGGGLCLAGVRRHDRLFHSAVGGMASPRRPCRGTGGTPVPPPRRRCGRCCPGCWAASYFASVAHSGADAQPRGGRRDRRQVQLDLRLLPLCRAIASGSISAGTSCSGSRCWSCSGRCFAHPGRKRAGRAFPA